MNYISWPFIGLFILSASTSHAQSVTMPAPNAIYLACTAPNDPSGVNDVYVDFAKRVITNYFGTSHPFREEGPHLIAETFVEDNGNRKVATTLKINRYTLTFEYIWPSQQILTTGQCTLVGKKL